MAYNYKSRSSITFKDNEEKKYKLNNYNETDSILVSNLIGILTTPSLSRLFTEEELFKMEMYLRFSVIDSLKKFYVTEQNQEEQTNKMKR